MCDDYLIDASDAAYDEWFREDIENETCADCEDDNL